MAKRPAKDWPYDLPTATCAVCRGTGMNRRQADAYVASRQAGLADGLSAQVLGLKCTACDGRGRVLTQPEGKAS